MKQAFHTVSVGTRGPGLYEFTDEALAFLRREQARDGLLTCFIRHTSASLLIQENADPDVRKGRPALGTWQGLYVFEHRDAPHQREVLLHYIGD